ncbi:hypothetical protein OCU04_009987 [Sclerotinia nivalis]|uniref:FAD linked oxidase N-terminal domain-containing protein n=1 Tax=Sclerotinia nivalis TaxID=352851 RepID=A0A9X0ADT7_9HELO|nr:hypothetical protein OCU04_009987 [Sclerotinia nivalis]
MASKTQSDIHQVSGNSLPDYAVEELRSSISGDVLIKSESLGIFCESENDVLVCLQYEQKWKLDFAVSGDRHNYHGDSSTKGLVIDLRRLKQVMIDKENMAVTAQGGRKAVDLEAPLQGG